MCIFVFALTSLGQVSRGKVDIQKKIADATPAALPQSPSDGRTSNDLQTENLRGRVKSVSYSYADSGSRDFPKARLMHEDFYDEAGNRVRGVDWDGAWPTNVTVFGYIDGMRVSRARTVEYAAAERPPSEGCVPLVHTIAEAAPPAADERYGIRWLYKYDDRGRLIEETHFNNRGDILTRTAYNYETDSRRVMLHYASGPEPLAKIVEIIDPRHGHVVEEHLHDEDGQVNLIRYFSYKFDKYGNWTEQRTTERSPSDTGRAKHSATAYRKITYFS
jgi:YD repeat-containing protein